MVNAFSPHVYPAKGDVSDNCRCRRQRNPSPPEYGPQEHQKLNLSPVPESPHPQAQPHGADRRQNREGKDGLTVAAR